ncbi:MAG TPA: hypothetical protein VF121_19290 [Thermoanaerobaculia bacterium]|nr:hypothetical protein [Thermoanaerobaculia bacterium]
MEDDRLERILATLPRERAGADFTARLLARLDDPPRHPFRLAAVGLAAAAAALAVAAAAGPLRPGRNDPAAESRIEAAEARRLLEELRREHRALESEIEALAAAPPVLYLGGDDEVDLVVDLSRVPAEGAVRKTRN